MVDAATRGRPPAGRLVGVAVLVLALAGIVLAHGVSGRAVPGRPIADWPAPPPVGSCVDLTGGFRVVPCSGPHDGEVTDAHDALDPIVTDTARSPMYDACAAAATAYLGADAAGGPIPGADGWRVPGPAYATDPVTAPPGQRVGRYAWQVCVIRPAVPARYPGTVRGATPAHMPDAYRTCLAADGAAASCSGPHAAEVLATAGRAATGTARRLPGESQSAITAQCIGVARRVVGSDDPTFGGRLTIAAGPTAAGPTAAGPSMTGGTVTMVAPDGPGGLGGSGTLAGANALATVAGPQDCVVVAPAGRYLTASVVGRGAAPAPLAGG